jgi:hypothetical protein
MTDAKHFVVPESMNSFVRDLAGDMHNMLVSAKDCNVTVTVGDKSQTRSFQAHSHMLRARSPYFDRALSATWAKKEGNTYVFKKPNVQPYIFELILK